MVWCGVERRGGGEEHVWWVRAENEMNLCERNTAQLWEAVFTSWRSSLTEPSCLKFFCTVIDQYLVINFLNAILYDMRRNMEVLKAQENEVHTNKKMRKGENSDRRRTGN